MLVCDSLTLLKLPQKKKIKKERKKNVSTIMAWGPLENSITKCAGDGTKIALYLTKTIKAYLIVGFSCGVNFRTQTRLMKMFSLIFPPHFFHHLLYTASALFAPFSSSTPFFAFLSSRGSPVPPSCPPSPLCLVNWFVCLCVCVCGDVHCSPASLPQ